MLSSFLLWLSIGVLYDILLLSYAMTSGNDHTYAKPLLWNQQEGNQLGDTLPVGTFEDFIGVLKLHIADHNKCTLTAPSLDKSYEWSFTAQVSHEGGRFKCYCDPRRRRRGATPASIQKFFGISRSLPVTPELIQICHSIDGSVWVRGVREGRIDLRSTGQETTFPSPNPAPKRRQRISPRPKGSPSMLQRLLAGSNSVVGNAPSAAAKRSRVNKATPMSKVAVDDHGFTSSSRLNHEEVNGDRATALSGSLGDGEDILARAMTEAGINKGTSSKYGKSPAPLEGNRIPGKTSISAKGVTGAVKAPRLENASLKSDGAAGDEGVSAKSAKMEYSMPSTSIIDKNKGEELESRADGKNGIGSPSGEMELPEVDAADIDSFFANWEDGGIFDGSASRSEESPQLAPYTFKDLLQAWES